jgi:hypothetical protein
VSERAEAAWCVRASRWRCQCVIELFVFLKMGAAPERVTVIPIGEDNSDLRRVYERLGTFNMRTARCFRPEDREWLQACVARGFGEDATAFNVAVRNLFRQSLQEHHVAAPVRVVSTTSPPPPQNETSPDQSQAVTDVTARVVPVKWV